MGLSRRLDFKIELFQKDMIPTLFVARMMVIYLVFIKGIEFVSPPFLAFFTALDYLSEIPGLYFLLIIAFNLSLILVFLGIRHKSFSMVLGVLIFFIIATNRVMFSNSLLYSGLILFLIGIYKPGFEWVFRAQISLLYVGAGINKIFDGDWLNGTYIINFFSTEFKNPTIISLIELMPGNSGSILLSVLIIVTEIGLGIGVWFSSRRILVFLLIFVFHVAMLIMTFGELSLTFYFLMTSSSPLILIWKDENYSNLESSNNPKEGKSLEKKFLELSMGVFMNLLKKNKILSSDLYFYSKNRVLFEIFYALIICCIYMLFSYKNYFN